MNRKDRRAAGIQQGKMKQEIVNTINFNNEQLDLAHKDAAIYGFGFIRVDNNFNLKAVSAEDVLKSAEKIIKGDK